MKRLFLMLAVMVIGISVWAGTCSRFDPYPRYDRHGEPMQESMWSVSQVVAQDPIEIATEEEDQRLTKRRHRSHRRRGHHRGHRRGHRRHYPYPYPPTCFIGTVLEGVGW